LGAEREPESEWEQHAGGDEREGVAAGEQFDADDCAGDHAGEGPGDQEPGERVEQPSFVPEAQQSVGTAATLNRRLVGVTAGLGTCRMLSWIGSRSTAPDTPAGVVISARRNAQPAPTGHSQGTPGSLTPQGCRDLSARASPSKPQCRRSGLGRRCGRPVHTIFTSPTGRQARRTKPVSTALDQVRPPGRSATCSLPLRSEARDLRRAKQPGRGDHKSRA
jgi:hypothetical protein